MTVTLAASSFAGSGSDVEFRLLSALHHDGGHAVEPVQTRLQIVVGHRPELRLRHRVGGQAVADDGKAGKGQAMRLDDSRSAAACRALWASAASTSCSVVTMSTCQSKNRSISAEPRLVIERTCCSPGTLLTDFFDRPRDGDHHLVDRHHAVVDADHDTRGKSVVGKTEIGMVKAR